MNDLITKKPRKTYKNTGQHFGIGDVPSTYYTRLKHGAKNRNKEFNITPEYISKLFDECNGICPFTQEKLVFYSQRQNEKGFPTTASLDRINNEIGYIKGNVRWLHKDINKIKGQYTDSEMISLAKEVINYQNNKNQIIHLPYETRRDKLKIIPRNYLTVIEECYLGKSKAVRCKCVCGNEVIRRKSEYYDEHKLHRCCGCKYSEFHRLHTSIKSWKGCGDISLSYYNDIVWNAKRRDIACLLTIEEIWNMFIEQKGICKLSGRKLILCDLRDKAEYNTSLDRIDSSKPYTIDNVIWVDKEINMMRKDLPIERFLYLCEKLANYQPNQPN